jgi:hypothetical protein
MPRIPTDVLAATIYLYPDRASAERGDQLGGTGSIVTRKADFSKKRGPLTYFVTNWHVAVKAGNSVVRVTANDGTPRIFEFDPSDWVFNERGHDVAVIEAPMLERPELLKSISTDMFACQDRILSESIGPGEDVCMVGRFVCHDGGKVNRPSLRFGNISVMPTMVRQPNGVVGECYCLDLHSRAGYSGSPVFAYRTFGQDLVSGGADRTKFEASSDRLRLEYRNLFVLLGIHCAQFPEEWIVEKKRADIRPQPYDEHQIATIEYVRGFSGMAVVVPAWRIVEILDLPIFDVAKARSYDRVCEAHPGMFEPRGQRKE